MKQVLVVLVLVCAILTLTGCDVLTARYQASAARAAAQSAESYAQAEVARSAAVETQALQATAQTAQVEASNRMMAFLATLVTLTGGDSGALMVALIVAGGVIMVALFRAGSNR